MLEGAILVLLRNGNHGFVNLKTSYTVMEIKWWQLKVRGMWKSECKYFHKYNDSVFVALQGRYRNGKDAIVNTATWEEMHRSKNIHLFFLLLWQEKKKHSISLLCRKWCLPAGHSGLVTALFGTGEENNRWLLRVSFGVVFVLCKNLQLGSKINGRAVEQWTVEPTQEV